MPLKLGLVGYGRMGKEVEKVAHARGHVVLQTYDVPHLLTPDAEVGDIDVFIEFTQPDVALANIEIALKLGKPIVVGTTGWHQHLSEVEDKVKRAGSGLIYASNFSIGMNIFFRLTEFAARLLDNFAEYDPFLHEAHHRGKLDSPSGTAVSLAQLVLANSSRKTELLTSPPAGKIQPHQLHVSSTRSGAIPGMHSVCFDSEADTIELKHTARNRSGFALGAVHAAEWIVGKQGLYSMADLLDDRFGNLKL